MPFHHLLSSFPLSVPRPPPLQASCVPCQFPVRKGCKKGSTLAHGSNPPGSPSGHALPRLSFSDNSIIPRQERAIKVTLGYFRIPFWLTCYPESGNRHCFRLRTLAPPVPATVLTRPWPDCHPSCPAGKGCKKGSSLAHGSNPPGSPSRLTSSHIFPFLTILSYHVKNMHPESPW